MANRPHAVALPLNTYRSVLLRLLAVLPLVLLAACSGGDAGSPSDAGPSSDARSFTSNDEDAEVLDVLLQNLTAFEDEDLDGAMAALDPDSPIFEPTKAHVQEIFEQYDLAYRFLDLEVTSRTDTQAVIQFTQETRRLSGPDFRDNQVVGRHLLRKRDGEWVIYQTIADEVTFLDEE